MKPNTPTQVANLQQAPAVEDTENVWKSVHTIDSSSLETLVDACDDSKRAKIIHSDTRGCSCMLHLCSLSSSSLGILRGSNSGVDLLAVLPPYTRGRSTVAATLTGADTDN